MIIDLMRWCFRWITQLLLLAVGCAMKMLDNCFSLHIIDEERNECVFDECCEFKEPLLIEQNLF